MRHSGLPAPQSTTDGARPMSDPSAVIAEVLCGKHFDGMHLNLNGGRLRWGSAFEISEGALAELKSAGYAVVKLPEPTGYWGKGPEWLQCNRVDYRNGWVVWTARGSRVMVQRVEPGDLTPTEARELAATLLAAADAAEGESDDRP